MLDIEIIRKNRNEVYRAIKLKGVNLDLDELLKWDQTRVRLHAHLQNLQAQKNQIAKKVREAPPPERDRLIQAGRDLHPQIQTAKSEYDHAQNQFKRLMLEVPNIPWDKAPQGLGEEANQVVRTIGEVPQWGFKPRGHQELLELNDWAEFKRMSQIAGERAYALKGQMVQVEMALHQMALKKLTERGFETLTVPSFAREPAFIGTGHFPKGKDQVYHMPQDGLYLGGTGEVILNDLYREEILDHCELPLRLGAISPCFRREAGSAGRDVGGLIRVHQFTKVEQYVLAPSDWEQSMAIFDELLLLAEDLMQELTIPYRVVECCTGDMGLGKVRMADIEAWVPSEGRYRETHSCSFLGEWQARRAGLRYRNRQGQIEYCHTLNCTAIATPRILVPLIENFQRPDGSVEWPQALGNS